MATVLHRAPTLNLLARAIHAIDRVATGLADHRHRAAVLRDLQGCDERDLRDLAISRYDFEAIANGTYKR